MEKVSVIGAGNVGATVANLLVQKKLADVVLVDIVEGLAKGKALDIGQAMAAQGILANIDGTDNYKDIADSTLIVITAGFPRGPGMSRADLLKKNAGVIRSVVAEIKKYSPLSMILVVTNPLDEMTFLAYQLSELSRTTVFGMGGVLDSARFTYFIAKKLAVRPKDVSAMVIGSHSDAMIPLTDKATAGDISLKEMLSLSDIEQIVEKTRKGGAEIISHLKEGSAFYGPAASVVKMAEAILLDTKAVLPCSTCLKGEYGLQDVCLSVPVKLGKNGIEEFIELELDSQQLELLQKSAAQFKENLSSIENA